MTINRQEMSKADKLNLTATVVGPILICGFIAWVGWSVDAKFTIALGEQERRNNEMFVSKPWFKDYHEETIKKIDGLTVDVGQVKETVAGIRGELSTRK